MNSPWIRGKHDTIVSENAYDPEGLRVVKSKYINGVLNDTTHYVFEGPEPIFEKRISDGRIRSYVFALGKHLARVDGVIGDGNAEKFFYHTDHVGSVRAVSNAQGEVMWKADYLAFGSRYGKEGTFEEERGFGGKEYDSDTGLYYFNARWYDSELGRFISEDPAMDPNSPNLYSFCGNNAINRVDPSGLEYIDIYGSKSYTYIDIYGSQGNYNGPSGGPSSGGSSGGPSGSSPNLPPSPDFSAPNARQQYEEYWKKVPGDAFKDPEALNTLLIIMWMGIDKWGASVRPSAGWGTGNYIMGQPNHTDEASMNMVKAIQATLGSIPIDGRFGKLTNQSLRDWGYNGGSVGQRVITRLLLPMLNRDFQLPTDGRVTSVFGERIRPTPDASKYHRGWDIANKLGTEIESIEAGIVIYAKNMGGINGNVVIIDHGHGIYSYYFHLDSYSVREGQQVQKGSCIAKMGTAGTGPHLHFAISTGGTLKNYDDPLKTVSSLSSLPYDNRQIKVNNGQYSNIID